MSKHSPFHGKFGSCLLPRPSALTTGQYFAVVHGSFHRPEHLGQACGFPMLQIHGTNQATDETSLSFLVPDPDGIRRLAYWLTATNKKTEINGSILYLKRVKPNLTKNLYY